MEVLGRRQDQNPFNHSAIVLAKVSRVTGQEVSRSGDDCGEEDGLVLFREVDFGR
jgi:hypothetical protein